MQNPNLKSVIREGPAVQIKDSLTIQFVDKRPPAIGTFAIYFLDPFAKQIANGSADAYIPR
jgi:hypothetical protein